MRTISIALIFALIAPHCVGAQADFRHACGSNEHGPCFTLPSITLKLGPTGYRFASETHGEIAHYATGAMRELKVARKSLPQPAVSFNDADGNAITLTRFRGKVVIVNLWASWCAPCKAEIPALAVLQRTYANKDLVVVPISVDHSTADAKSFLTAYDSLPLFDNSDFSMPIALGVTGLPTTVIYDRKGREVGRFTGAANWASPEARVLVDYLLAKDAHKNPRSPH